MFTGSRALRDWQNNLRRRLKAFLISALLITGCGSLPKLIDRPDVAQGKSVPLLYSQGLQKIDQGKYAEARSDFELFLNRNPVSNYSQVANFNVAYTFEMQRSFKEAAAKYREVAVNTVKSAPKLQANSLYRLSYCLEASGDDTQVVAVLDDVNQRKELLPPEIANAELPARRAAAYSRVGNSDLAQQLYNQAASSMIQYRRQSDKTKQPAWLAKTLYHMGRSNLRDATWENFEIVVRPLTQAQDFLLEASELNDPIWSKKASDDLTAVYNNLWQVIQHPPDIKGEDEVLKARASQQRQWEMTFQLVDLIDALKRHQLKDQTSPFVTSLFNEIEKVQKQIKKMLAQQKIGSDLTPAARKRILNRKSFSKLPEKRSKTQLPTMTPPPVEIPAEGSTPSSEDPNL